jgi:hypothetical protein
VCAFPESALRLVAVQKHPFGCPSGRHATGAFRVRIQASLMYFGADEHSVQRKYRSADEHPVQRKYHCAGEHPVQRKYHCAGEHPVQRKYHCADEHPVQRRIPVPRGGSRATKATKDCETTLAPVCRGASPSQRGSGTPKDRSATEVRTNLCTAFDETLHAEHSASRHPDLGHVAPEEWAFGYARRPPGRWSQQGAVTHGAPSRVRAGDPVSPRVHEDNRRSLWSNCEVPVQALARLHFGPIEHMFVEMDRFHELENLRRSLAMLPPGSSGLDREESMRLVAELQLLERRMDSLREKLTQALDEVASG